MKRKRVRTVTEVYREEDQRDPRTVAQAKLQNEKWWKKRAHQHQPKAPK